MKYPPVYDGEWLRPNRKSFKMACCDCGLVHRLEFKVRKRRLYFRAFRDNRATGQVRRWMKKKCQGLWRK